MSLPKLTLPQYEITLPSTGEKIMFRPFTVKEEKLLLMAIDDDDEVQIRTLRQVIQSCLLNYKLDVAKLPTFDIDYLWLKLRSKSVEEIVVLPFECHGKLPEGTTQKDSEGVERNYCGNIVNVPINLDTIEVKKYPENNPKIELQDHICIKMKYPTFEIFQKIAKLKEINDIDNTFNVIIECIDMIYESDTGKTYEKEYIDHKELVEFLETLTQTQFAKIMNFFETLPVIQHKVHFKCPKCKFESDVVIEGTKSFLASVSATNHSET